MFEVKNQVELLLKTLTGLALFQDDAVDACGQVGSKLFTPVSKAENKDFRDFLSLHTKGS